MHDNTVLARPHTAQLDMPQLHLGYKPCGLHEVQCSTSAIMHAPHPRQFKVLKYHSANTRASNCSTSRRCDVRGLHMALQQRLFTHAPNAASAQHDRAGAERPTASVVEYLVLIRCRLVLGSVTWIDVHARSCMRPALELLLQ